MPIRRQALWGLAALAVLAGWVWGFFSWRTEEEASFGTYFETFTPTIVLMVGVPLSVGAAVLLAKRGAARVGGYLLLVLLTLVLAWLASSVFFGGFCVDPGEQCVTSWPSRIFGLGAALACLFLGFGLQLRLDRRQRPGAG